jgi:hypothetical protein
MGSDENGEICIEILQKSFEISCKGNPLKHLVFISSDTNNGTN